MPSYQLGNSVHKLFRRIPRRTIHELSRTVNEKAWRQGLTYVDDDGKKTVITLTLRPRVIDLKKRNALWSIIRTLDGAYKKIAPLYFKNPKVAGLFPFSSHELDWLSMMKSPPYRPGQIATRWDANTTFGESDWKEGFSFFEVNGVGIGGLWYGPTCADVLTETVVPELQKLDPHFRAIPHHDMRQMLLALLLEQRKKLGRNQGMIALAMEKASGSNYVEFEFLARLFKKMGHDTRVVEPTDFSLKENEIYTQGERVDLIYRDATLEELCLWEEKGHNLEALRLGFRRGQIVSSLEGEFDHKSAFELFSNPEHTSLFTSREKQIFKRYILWTRLLTERKTPDWNERSVDLVPFVLKNQSVMVLKPNRLYGGKGVVFGRDVTRRVWQEKIEASLRQPGDWVVQRLGRLRKKRFFRPDGKKPSEKDLFVVSGFFATPKGLGIVGRMSERAVVNVARRGGLTPILLIR